MTPNKGNRGFTTLELAMVLIVFAMVVLTVMTAFKYYNTSQSKAVTDEAFDTSESGLLAFKASFNRYPCPAGPNVPRGAANYGREEIDGAGNCTETNGVEEAPAAGIDMDGNAVDDSVWIGSVPFNTMLDPDNNPATNDGIQNIPLRDGSTYDGFGHRLTYAVTDNLTRVATYNDFFGAIEIVDENDNPLTTEKEDIDNDGVIDVGEDTNNNGVLDQAQYAHIVLVSHGDNGRGAYTASGVQTEGCPAGLPVALFPSVATAISEVENCDGDTDNKFLSGLRRETDHSYNDDTIRYLTNETSGLWAYVPGSNTQIMNMNAGNVGFDEPNPQDRLHIAGNLRSQLTRSAEYCDITGTNCMPPEVLGGDLAQMECPPGEVITAIEQNAVFDPGNAIDHCVPAFTGPIIARNCPANCYASGFRRDGGGNTTLVCRQQNDTDGNGTLDECP